MKKYDPAAAAELFPEEGWFKSSYSDTNGTGCVDVNITSENVGVRDRKQPEKGTFVFTHGEWAGFLQGAKDGQFDLPA